MFLHMSVILFTGRSLSRGLCPGKGDLCPGGGLYLGGSLSVCQGDPLWTETPRKVTCGRYASYWNAFLFPTVSDMNHIYQLCVLTRQLTQLFYCPWNVSIVFVL